MIEGVREVARKIGPQLSQFDPLRTALKQARPGIRISGMGGQEMKRAGVDLFFDSSIIAVVGLVEVLRHWGDIKRAMNIVRRKLEQTRPDLLVLVDWGLKRLAEALLRRLLLIDRQNRSM